MISDLPTVTETRDGFRVSGHNISVSHSQRWQAELRFETQALAMGITLPAEWFQRRLGERAKEVA